MVKFLQLIIYSDYWNILRLRAHAASAHSALLINENFEYLGNKANDADKYF
jgi:hypothetical protein